MRHIRDLWNKLRVEIRLWKYEKRDLISGIIYGCMVCWLFYDRLWILPWMLPLLIPWMRHRRKRRKQREKDQIRKEFREMMVSVGNSLSVGYSLENAMKTARDDLRMFQGEGVLEKELYVLIVSLKMNEPVDKLLLNMAENVNLEELRQFAEIVAIVKKSGGNLIEIIGKTVDHLSQAMQLKEEIRTMTAAKQMEKRVMTVMPYAILVYVRIANPGYFQVLYESIPGEILSTVALICLWGADIWSERVIEVEI